MQYFRAYGFIFDSPQWLITLLIGIVCMFVPVVGPMVFMGYLYDVIEALHRDPEQVYPPFDFNRLLDYLIRGAWPFLVRLLVSLPFVFLTALLVGVCIAVAVAVSGGDSSGPGWVLVPVAIFVVFACMFAMSLVAMPMALCAGLAQDFAAGFDTAFVRDFLARVWRELIIAELFLGFSGLTLVVLGYAALCVGVYPAAVWINCAMFHLHYQLYELYLQRGGTPIPLKPRPTGPANQYQ